MAETIKFPTNIPVALELKFDTGLECQSQFNGQDQVCYTLADDRRMYLSPAVARKIAVLGIVRAVPFTICKKEKQVGMRKTIDCSGTRCFSSSIAFRFMNCSPPRAE